MHTDEVCVSRGADTTEEDGGQASLLSSSIV